MNELISIVRSVCGVSFKFNSKFSCFCQKNLAKEFYHFSDLFNATESFSNPQESIQQDSMNIETTPQQPNLAPQEAISINHDAVKNSLTNESSSVKGREYTINLTLPSIDSHDDVEAFIKNIINKNRKVFDDLYNETRTLTTTPLDLRNYSDDQKKDLLKKNSIIIMRFHGNDREAILVKTNPTKAVVYMNDQLYCISYKSIVEYKGQSAVKNPLETIRERLEVGKSYHTRDGPVLVKKLNPDNASAIRKEDGKMYSYPYDFFDKDPSPINDDNIHDYDSSVVANSMIDIRDDDHEIDF